MYPTRILLALRILWALPCSVVGALFGGVVVCLGGSVRRVDHGFEVGLSVEQAEVPGWVRASPFGAITFGHVIVGQSHQLLAALRPHERVHVRQYEQLGPLFFIAYPASSLLAWMQGRCPYRGNRFERQAVALALLQGGRDRGAPGPRLANGEDDDAAFVVDPHGQRIEAVVDPADCCPSTATTAGASHETRRPRDHGPA